MDAEPCPKGGDHQWKFNGGDPVCSKCWTYRGEPSVIVLPATTDAEGNVTVHIPGGREVSTTDHDGTTTGG